MAAGSHIVLKNLKGCRSRASGNLEIALSQHDFVVRRSGSFTLPTWCLREARRKPAGRAVPQPDFWEMQCHRQLPSGDGSYQYQK